MSEQNVTMYQLIVFDLDGTLIDSETDLMLSANYTLREFGFSERSEAEVRSYIGNGAIKLLERCLPEECHEKDSTFALPHLKSDIKIDPIYQVFMDHYLSHCHENTFIHEGVMEFLTELKDKQAGDSSELKLAILTNKPLSPTQQILEHLQLDSYFFQVIGGDSFATKKPHPVGLNHIMEQAQVDPEQVLMIGDGLPDMLVAQAAGVDSVAILEGIGSEKQLLEAGPTYSIRRFQDISKLQLQIG